MRLIYNQTRVEVKTQAFCVAQFAWKGLQPSLINFQYPREALFYLNVLIWKNL